MTVELPNSPHAPRAARALVAAHLGDERRSDEASLCVSEVVTNAVLHGESAPLVHITVAARIARFETHDDSPVRPVMRNPDPSAIGGRGLRIVDALADRWGTTSNDGGGKVVWFELDLDRVPADGGADRQEVAP